MKYLYELFFRREPDKQEFSEYVCIDTDIEKESNDLSYAANKICSDMMQKTGDIWYLSMSRPIMRCKVFGYYDRHVADVVVLEPDEVVCKVEDTPVSYKSLKYNLERVLKTIAEKNPELLEDGDVFHAKERLEKMNG